MSVRKLTVARVKWSDATRRFDQPISPDEVGNMGRIGGNMRQIGARSSLTGDAAARRLISDR